MQQQPPQLPGALQQAPDGSLYVPPGLQSLHASDAVFAQQQQQQQQQQVQQQQQQVQQQQVQQVQHQQQQQQQYAQQHAQPLHFEHYASFPPAPYPHAASPPFVALPEGLHTPRVPQQRPLHHINPPLQPAPQHHDQPYPQLPPHLQQQHQQHQHQQPHPPPPQQQQQPPPDDDSPFANHGQFQGLKLIPNPPNLDEWRARLFDVDETITLTEEEFQTYFPHIDNIYSHRSTQRHKRRRFVSHYWDCRLKGRPPGTKKSTDPDKKKRKRVARERDLCDVKVKITEFFDQREYEEQMGHPPPGLSADAGSSMSRTVPGTVMSPDQNMFFQPSQMMQQQPLVPWDMTQNLGQAGMNMASFAPGPPPLPGPPSKKFYTFQRVNGNGGNGKGDGVAGPHKHSLEESDRVKKNSVVRWLAKFDRDKKKGGDASKKTYHKKATGNALTTVKNHAKEDDLKLYGSCFCPFVQRVWISLEHKQIPYQYIEVDPYKKPQSLLDVNPRGLVPAIRHGPTWSTHESTVIMEYLEDLNTGPALLPRDPQSRATSRLWSDHVNRNIIPLFYKLLQSQDANDQITHATALRDQINKLVSAADATGPFFLGPEISFVDVQLAPWVVRLRRVLGPYRGWPEAEEGSRWRKWVDAIDEERSVKMTTSTDELYLDSYERYAENRPGTSQLADAVNSGRGLP